MRRPTIQPRRRVSDRDFALDYLHGRRPSASLHLSRLAEEFIVWASQPYAFVSPARCAIRPAARSCRRRSNPDAAELVRGHAGRIAGCMIALTMTMKGLPLAYSKDMQDDKPPVFEAARPAGALDRGDDGDGGGTVTFRTRPRLRQAAEAGFSPPRPTWPTGWSAWPTCPSAKRTTLLATAVKLAQKREGLALDQAADRGI